MTRIIRLSDKRVRQIIHEAYTGGMVSILRIGGTINVDEVLALAQNVIDLRTANNMQRDIIARLEREHGRMPRRRDPYAVRRVDSRWVVEERVIGNGSAGVDGMKAIAWWSTRAQAREAARQLNLEEPENRT